MKRVRPNQYESSLTPNEALLSGQNCEDKKMRVSDSILQLHIFRSVP